MLDKIKQAAAQRRISCQAADWRGAEPRPSRRLLWKVEMSLGNKSIQVVGWVNSTRVWLGHRNHSGKRVETQYYVNSFSAVVALMDMVFRSEQLRRDIEEAEAIARKKKLDARSNVIQLRPHRKKPLR